MAGFFDSLGDYVSESMDSRMGDRPGESDEQMIRRKMPFTSYVDETIGNIPQGLMEAGQGTYEAVTHPRQTAESLAGYVMNPRQTASDIYQHYADRYRDLPTALETLRTDPVGVAGDVLPFTALPSIARGVSGAAGRAARAAERAREVIPPSAMRDVGSTPSGWDFAGPRRAGPTIEGTSGDWDAITGLRRTDRTRPWREPLFPEPRLNPEGVPSPIEGGGGPSGPVPPAGPRRAVNYTSETPLLPYTNYSPRLSTELNTNVADLIRNIRAEGRAPNRFEQNMIDRYFSGMQGQAAAEAMANMPVTVVPRGVQRTLNAMREGRKPTSLEMSNLRKHFAGRTGLKSRAALEGQSMREAVYGPSGELIAKIPDRFFPTEELPANVGRESLVRRALDVASRVAPRVGEGMVAGGLGGMGAYLAARNMGESATPPVVPVVTREERQPVAAAVTPRSFTEFPMTAGPLGTEFDSGKMLSKDVPETAETPRPPRRPAATTKERPVTPRRSAPKRAAPQRQRDTGKRYYGDYRDTEPFASDPIGQFIDELTGQRKMARRPGRQAPSSGNLGDLLPFADGGTVRRPFADGGVEDRIPILSDIGDALGGFMQGGEQPVVAADRSAPAGGGENIFERWSNNPLSQYLFAAGLGMMASPQTHPLMAIGEGGLRGLEYMQAVQANADMRRREREAAANRKEILERSREIQKGLSGEGDEQTSAPVPSKTSEAEPAVPSVVAPIKTAEAEPGQAVPPQETLVSAPQEQVKPPVQAAPAPQPVVAADNQIKRINRAIQEFSSLREASSDSMTRNDLDFKIRQLESARNKIEKQQERAIQDARYQEQLNIQRERLEEQKRQASFPYKRQVQKEEKLGTKLNELETEINEAAGSAKDYIESFDVYKKGIENGNIITGAYGEDRLNTHKTLQALAENTGAYSKDWMENAKLRSQLSDDLKSGAIQQVFSQLKGHLGAGISDADRKAIQLMGISLDRDANSNLDSIETFQKAQQRNIEAAKFMEDYKQNKSSIPGELDGNFQAAFTKWRNEQPSILPDRLKAMISKNKEGPAMPQEGDIIKRGDYKYSWDSASKKYKIVR